MNPKGYAAIFLDFENIFYFLANNLPEAVDATDAVVEMVRSLRSQVLETRGEQCIIQHAYADFERIETNTQGALYLLGVETHNVLSTDHKNTADMQLCIHALETLYTRREIETFIFIAGDRDYIPVIQHLKKHARNVLVVAFEGNMSGDLRLNVGEEYFIDAKTLLPGDTRKELRTGTKVVTREKALVGEGSISPRAYTSEPAPKPVGQPEFMAVMDIKETNLLEGLEILLRYFGHHNEVFLMPFLHKLRIEMPQLAEFERKALVSALVSKGAVSVQKRRGEPNDYSVMIINWDHPDVREMNPGGF